MLNLRISYSFIELSDALLDEFASSIVTSLTDNPAFPTPLVPLATLNTARLEYHAALVAAQAGGIVLTAIKNQKREALETLLRKLATYVQGLASQDLAMLLSSGFLPVSTNRAQSPLATPVIAKVENSQSGRLVAQNKSVPNARAYEWQIKNGGGWMPGGVFAKTRDIQFRDLTPGQVYSVQARAIGGSTGFSAWSDPVSRMVT